MEYYVGLDVSLKQTSICVVDRTGSVVREGVVDSDPDAISVYVRSKAPAREARGITASQFSRSMGVTPAAVWYWEKKGFSSGNPALEQIAKTLGVSVRFLRSGKEEVSKKEFAFQPIVASILEDARARIAQAADLDLERVKLSVQFASERDVEHN